MSEQDPILRALGRVAREQEEHDVEPQPLRAEQIDRFARAAVDARGPKVVRIARRQVLVGLAMAAALAAGVVFYMRVPASSPRYAMSIEGADQPMRGDDAGAPAITFSKGALVRVVLKPEGGAGAETAVAYLMRGDDVRAITAPIARAPNGAMRFEGVREQIFGDAAGTWDVVVFVGPLDRLPRDGSEAKTQRATRVAAAQVLVAPVILP